MKIQLLCDNPKSWMTPYARTLLEKLLEIGYEASLIYSSEDVVEGDILILLSCEGIYKKLYLNKHNLVIHSSALPQGKGWSPMTWQILEGKDKIPVTIFEAVENVDAGPIYGQLYIELDGTELVDELRMKQSNAILQLIFEFLEKYPDVESVQQKGETSFYLRRKPEHSKLDIEKTIAQQFNHLRVCDNERYPAYFEKNGVKYILKIYKEK